MTVHLQNKIQNFFVEDEKNLQNLFDQLSFYLFSKENDNSDLYYLAKLLPHNELVKIVNYFDGDVIRMPSKKDFRKQYIISICFFLKKVLNWDWNKIKGYLNLSPKDEYFSAISFGKEINKIDSFLNKDLKYLSKHVKIENIENFLKEIKKWKKEQKNQI